ncbi:cyclic nucleotide-binding domain protein (macronuclear) [Tetrahymena thermophila SB210]|uniref:Cyclic nucleotide-binding domain protein n=1 Tax=Tetrahymena thermophila (strain SB210) TaxID=312017 RepID=Q22UD0_TETTS|nr:cyclic nucleotide-binding domain protein [Tetrahymena thermophila SB210]EAR88757.2 cyclic nucleotide-binding domain protein [Tetrahymena thermophila SB210]|eukprot:XP_001009002.2 cyclic nucleotide-binding domain protein [Tetrahymena thermophila SB210]
MFDYAQATATFMKRGSLDTDHLVDAMKKKDKVIPDELNHKNQLLLEILDKNTVNLQNEEDSNMAIYICRKAVKNQLEIEFLLKIIEGLDIFQKHQDVKANCSRIILNNIKYRFYKKNECVFRVGDKGGSYFIVLKGSVHCLIPDLKKDDKGDDQDDDLFTNNSKPSDHSTEYNQKFQKANQNVDNQQISYERKVQNQINSQGNSSNAPNSQLPKKILFRKSNTMSESRTIALLREHKKRDEDQDFLEHQYPNMKLVKTYSNGGAFGEIALLTKEKRTATMVCEQDTHFMCLSKEGFDQIMGAYREFVFNERVEYLRQFSFFKNIPTSQLLSLWHYMKEEKFNMKNIIYTENDPSCFIFFIRKGEVQISKIAKEEEVQQEYLQLNEEDVFASMNISKQKKEKKINQSKRVPLVLLGPNCYFGDEEIFQKLPSRISQAQCQTESQILIIEKKKLFGFLRYHDQFQKFKDDVKVKSNWKEQQLQKPSYLNYQKEKLKPLKEQQSNGQQINDKLTPKISKQNSQIFFLQKKDSAILGPPSALEKISSNDVIPLNVSTPSQGKLNLQRTKSFCYNEINIATTPIHELMKFKQQLDLHKSPQQEQSNSQKLISIAENTSFDKNEYTNEKYNIVTQKVRQARLSNGIIIMDATPKRKSFVQQPANTFFTELMKDFTLPDLNPTYQSDEKQESQQSINETSIVLSAKNANKKQLNRQKTNQFSKNSSQSTTNIICKRNSKAKICEDQKQITNYLQSDKEAQQSQSKIRKFNSQKLIRGASYHQDIQKSLPQLKTLTATNKYQEKAYKNQQNIDNFIYNNAGESLEYLNDSKIKKQKEFLTKIQNTSSIHEQTKNILSIDATIMSVSSKKNNPLSDQTNKFEGEQFIKSPSSLINQRKKNAQTGMSFYQNSGVLLSKKSQKEYLQEKKGPYGMTSSLILDNRKNLNIDLRSQQENIFTDKNKFLGLQIRKQLQFSNWKFQTQPSKIFQMSSENIQEKIQRI